MFRTTFGIAVALSLMTACGQPRNQRDSSEPVDQRPTTGGVEFGRAYTAYGPAPDIEKVKERVQATPANVEFAGHIETAFLMKHHGRAEGTNALRIQIKWRELTKPLEFWGELKMNDGRLVGTLREESGQKKGLVIIAACADQACNTVSADVYSDRVLKSGIIFRKEARLVQARATERERQLLTCFDPKFQELANKYIQGVQVIVSSTEIVPGRTHFKLYDGEPNAQHAQAEGNLMDTDGDCTPLTGDAESIFARICLAGNSGTGTLVFRAKMPEVPASCLVPAEDRQDPALYLQVRRNQDSNGQPARPDQQTQPPARAVGPGPAPQRPSPQVPAPQPPVKQAPAAQPPVAARPATPHVAPAGEFCAPLTGEGVHPFLKQIYKDCGHPVVVAKMKETLSVRGSRRNSLIRFLTVADGAFQGKNGGQIPEYNKMKDIYKANGIPISFGFISLHESGFTANAISSAGARGWHQMMPNTALGLGISLAQTHQIEPATRAISKFFQQLIRQWTKVSTGELNFKMLLVSYNAGPARSEMVRDSMERRRRQGQVRFADLTSEQIQRFSEDFWELNELGMLPLETRRYVPSILSLFFAGIRPDAADLTLEGQPAFPDLD
ncbi:MAG: transglycosylase SLT domain-containing protein [Bdellovibrionia bacterium]